MNIQTPLPSNVADLLLADIARKIQLSPTNYRTAQQHYGAIYKHLVRAESPIAHAVQVLYPQGSMAIGSVISSKFENDEFDIDVVAQLLISPDTRPAVVLDTLFSALNGKPGSQYHGRVHRRTRCVTVDYPDMHVDVTPAVLLGGRPPRTSVIFHAHEKQPASEHRHVLANPWGFADWFEKQMPAAQLFAEAVLRKSAEPIPPPEVLEEKAVPLIALQLMKRWTNKIYEPRLASGSAARKPPGVVLAYFAARSGRSYRGLLQELQHQCSAILTAFEGAARQRNVLVVENPACEGDVFTDRWPGTLAGQDQFINDLKALQSSLVLLSSGISLPEQQRIMAQLFGEHAAANVFKEFANRYEQAAHRGQLHHAPKTGAIALNESGLGRSAAVLGAIATPKTRNFGS
ncbi:MAG: nucleotidyltransferase [Rhodospirillaceae bacterium]